MFEILAFTKLKQPNGNYTWNICGTAKVCRIPIKGEYISIPNSQLNEQAIINKNAGDTFFEVVGVIHSGNENSKYPAEIYLYNIGHLQALNLMS